jgi:rubredoxin
MGILDKILGKDKSHESEPAPNQPEELEPECPHTAMTPHWDSLDDMGKEELATYNCEACGRMFAHDQAQQYLDNPPAVLANDPTARE